MRVRAILIALISVLLVLLSLASCSKGEALLPNPSVEKRTAKASPVDADRALEVVTEYVQWLHVRSENRGEDDIVSEAWAERLQRAANDASGTDAGRACRT